MNSTHERCAIAYLLVAAVRRLLVVTVVAFGGLTAWAVLPGWLGSSPMLSAALTVWSGGLSWCAARWC